jgi:hypothetical protein
MTLKKPLSHFICYLLIFSYRRNSLFIGTYTSKTSNTMKLINDHDDEGVNVSESSVDQSHQSSHSNVSSNHNTTSNQSDECNKETMRTILSRHGTQAVFRLRLVVILVMTLTATAVSVIIYRTTSGDEDNEYSTQYDKAAEKVIESFDSILDRLTSINSIGIAATAFGLDHNETKWPFHTMSSFQQRASTTRLVSDALSISINPIVTEGNRKEWEEHVARSSGKWM